MTEAKMFFISCFWVSQVTDHCLQRTPCPDNRGRKLEAARAPAKRDKPDGRCLGFSTMRVTTWTTAWFPLKEKWSHFDPKIWVMFDESQIVNLILNVESIWLKYSQITRNSGANISSPVTHLFRSKWLHFSFSVRIQKEVL